MSVIDSRKMEPELSEGERAVRDLFIQEYLKDHNEYKACIRIGFQSNFAIEYAKQFMSEGYVLRGIAHFQRKPNLVPDEEDKAEMLENLRWLSHNGSSSSRTAATKAYMEAKGYIKKDDGGEEERMTNLANALRGFAENAPA